MEVSGTTWPNESILGLKMVVCRPFSSLKVSIQFMMDLRVSNNNGMGSSENYIPKSGTVNRDGLNLLQSNYRGVWSL